jgi:hypothetical protein
MQQQFEAAQHRLEASTKELTHTREQLAARDAQLAAATTATVTPRVTVTGSDAGASGVFSGGGAVPHEADSTPDSSRPPAGKLSPLLVGWLVGCLFVCEPCVVALHAALMGFLILWQPSCSRSLSSR